MARSPLTGIEPAAQEPPGRDESALGPSDTSDSGSDVAGRVDRDGGDPALPLDVALREPEAARADRPVEAEPSAADIGVDRVFVPGGRGDLLADAEADAALDGATANDPLDDEDEAPAGDDGDDAPDENERAIAAATKGVPAKARGRKPRKALAGATALAPIPAPPPDPPLPNPQPDLPVEDPEAPNDEGDAEIRKPGRDPAAAAQSPSSGASSGSAPESPPKRRRFVPPRRW